MLLNNINNWYDFANHIEYNLKIAKLTNSVQEFWNTFIDSDVVKGALDFITALIDGATTFVEILTPIPALIATIVGAFSLKSVFNKNADGGGRAKPSW